MEVLRFLILPAEISNFERAYLRRLNRISLVFFALHLPAFVLLAWLNGTRPALAAGLTSAVLAGPVLTHYGSKNPRAVSVVYGITAMFMGGLLVHFGQGPVQIEMHFYFFALLAMCAVYANPLVIVAAAVTVALHHAIVWLVLPRSVFNYDAAWWVVAVHAAFVVLESVATAFIARSFFDNVIGVEKIVSARTRQLDAKNGEMRALLDNVRQGFLTMDGSGHLSAERSKAVSDWFGNADASSSWFEYLSRISPQFAERTRLGWSEVQAGVMPEEVALGQMPSQLNVNSAHYRFEYRPIGDETPHRQYLVIVTDVTAEVEAATAELERRETLALFNHLLEDRSGLESFLDEADDTLEVLASGRTKDLSLVKRAVHTLKGNAGLYGLQSVADLCHSLEDYMAEEGKLPPASGYEALRARWASLLTDARSLLGTQSQLVEISDEQFAALEAAARSGETGAPFLARVRSLKLESTAKRLGHVRRQALQLAERLGKSETRVAVEDHGVRLDPKRWAGFWNAFVHGVRNALDHGIEPTEARLLAGKPGAGTVTLRARDDGERVVVEICDDGRGIDWPGLAARARVMGLPAETQSDLEKALFSDGVSTTEYISDVSGRGVGMGALLAATQALGGKLSVRSAVNQGTTLHFSFPTRSSRAQSGYPRAVVNGAEQ